MYCYAASLHVLLLPIRVYVSEVIISLMPINSMVEPFIGNTRQGRKGCIIGFWPFCIRIA